jgi:hypothetical protein
MSPILGYAEWIIITHRIARTTHKATPKSPFNDEGSGYAKEMGERGDI